MAGDDDDPSHHRPTPPSFPGSMNLPENLGQWLATIVQQIPDDDYQTFSHLMDDNFRYMSDHYVSADQLRPTPVDAGERHQCQEDDRPKEPNSEPGPEFVPDAKPKISTDKADEEDVQEVKSVPDVARKQQKREEDDRPQESNSEPGPKSVPDAKPEIPTVEADGKDAQGMKPAQYGAGEQQKRELEDRPQEPNSEPGPKSVPDAKSETPTVEADGKGTQGMKPAQDGAGEKQQRQEDKRPEDLIREPGPEPIHDAKPKTPTVEADGGDAQGRKSAQNIAGENPQSQEGGQPEESNPEPGPNAKTLIPTTGEVDEQELEPISEDSEAVKVSAAAEAKRMKNKKNKQRKQKKKKGGLCEKGDEGPESIPNFCHETCSCVPINIICFILFLIILLDQVTLSNDC